MKLGKRRGGDEEACGAERQMFSFQLVYTCSKLCR